VEKYLITVDFAVVIAYYFLVAPTIEEKT